MLHGFFGFLQSREFTCEAKDYSNSMLSVANVGVDSHSFVTIHLRQSKTDIFGVGATIHLGCVDGPICPGKALLAYLSLRGASPGPLFVLQDGSPLSRSLLVTEVRGALESHGLDVRGLNDHSFRIGDATTAAACSMEDSLI